MEGGGGRVVEAAAHGDWVVHGETWIDGVDGGGRIIHHHFFRLRSAQEDGEVALRTLEKGHVERAAGSGVELAFLNIVDDADDADAGFNVSTGKDGFADGVFTGEELLGEPLIDDADAGLGGGFVFGEPAAVDELCPQRGEVTGAHLTVDDLAQAIVAGATVNIEGDGSVAIAERQIAGEGHGTHAGKAAEARLELLLESEAGSIVFVGRTFGTDAESGDVIGYKSGIDVEEAVEAFAEEACAGKEHDGERELDDDEVRSEATPDGASGSASAGGEVFAEVGEGDADGRDNGEEDGSRERDERGEKNDAEIESVGVEG